MNKIRNVYLAHTINTVAGSIIGVYIPAYLLTLGYPLSRVILFFIILHGLGLFFALFLFVPLVQRWGLLNTFKLYYPLQILSLLLLSMLKSHYYPPELIAVFSGLATFAYWIPLNIFFIKHSQNNDMGSNMSKLYALPSLFGILGPVLGATLIPSIGFWPVFALTAIGVVASFIPLSQLHDTEVTVNLHFSKALHRVMTNKTLFLFEFLDNIIEESEWFWAVYVFVIIGSLATPGIVGSLQALGGSVFTLVIGHYANKHGKKLIPLIAASLLAVNLIRIFTQEPFIAYVVTVIAALLLNAFLVTYFSAVYKTIKNDNEEEFMVLREIPTVLGRMVVFVFIYITLPYLRLFFLLPLIVITFLLLLYFIKGKILAN